MKTDAPVVLVIAGSDSSGGAGLVRDLETLTHFNVAARCVITAVTAQSDRQVHAVHLVPPQVIGQQIDAAFACGKIAAIKIGMLGTAAAVHAATDGLALHAAIPVVLDPVMISSSGGCLLDDDGIRALRERLLPRVTVLTPNLAEAAALLGQSLADDEAAMRVQARDLLQWGPAAVLLKGGHARGPESTDLLAMQNCEPLRLNAARVSAEMRGSGCALASALAAGLAQGASLTGACRQAKAYVLQRLQDQAAVDTTTGICT